MGARRIYKALSPYPEDQLDGLDYAQSADVMYLAHLGYPPYKFERFGHTDWQYVEITFGPVVAAPGAPTVTVHSPNTTGLVNQNYRYVITAISDGSPVQESRASGSTLAVNDLSLNGNYNTITVPAPSAPVTRHVVYKEQGGIYGYIGSTDGTTIEDRNIQPLLSITPPLGNDPFAAAGDYPGIVTFHQQRLIWGGTVNVINGIWASRSADFENMDFARPSRADDAISFALVADKVNAITGLVSLDSMLAMTTDAIFAIEGNQTGVVTPSDINPKRTSGRGSRKVKPLVVDNVTFFSTARGKAIRALGFSFDIQGYKSDNVTIFSPHLFKVSDIKKNVYQEEPFSCVYTLLTDGTLLAFTWESEQQVWGWSKIETDGVFEDIEVIPELGFDRLYAKIRRTFGETERVFHERMALPHVSSVAAACHLDCSYTQIYDPPRSRITGAFHLAGQTVSMVYDGFVAHDIVIDECDGGADVPNGEPASDITVGLRYSGRLVTLPASQTQSEATNHVNRQQIADVIVRTIDTAGIEFGATNTLLEMAENGERVNEPNSNALDYRVPTDGDWKDTSSVTIEQNEPLPAHIVAVFARIITGKV